MAFRQKKQQPDFSSLLASLAQTKLKRNDEAGYQTIKLIIEWLEQFQSIIVKAIEEQEEDITNITNAGDKCCGLLAFDGEQGEDGFIGPPGIRGVDGAAGVAGTQGNSGPPGLDGEQGETIEPYLLPGPQGATGSAGATGATGATGPMGFPGYDAEEPIEPLMIPGPKGDTGAAAGGTFTTLRKTSNQTINAGIATFTDVTELTFPVVNGTRYAFYFYIVFQSANTGTGWKASVNCPAGTLDFHALGQTIANAAAGAATWLERHNVTRDDMTLLTSTVTAGVDLIFIVQGRYLCTADGTFAVRFANELANNDITVREGSWGFYF